MSLLHGRLPPSPGSVRHLPLVSIAHLQKGFSLYPPSNPLSLSFVGDGGRVRKSFHDLLA